MKRTSLVLLSVLLAPPLFADAGEHLIPAGSLISCTTAEPRLSSKTTAIGDPVLCQVGHSERYGRSVLPYNSYLVGRFEDYRDPGHFVGKGWMELKFDRMVIEPDTIIPIDARVVDAPGYKVDSVGRILGKGHAVRDAVLWSLPVLWPLDLLMLPMRGPRPTLKEETRLTLKIMDDLPVPNSTQPYTTDPYGLRHRSPDAYDAPPPAPAQDPQPQPEMAYAPQDQPSPQPEAYDYAPPAPAPVAYAYAAPVYIMPPPMIAYGTVLIAPPPVYAYGTAYAYAPGYVYGPRVVARPYGYRYGYGAGPRSGMPGGGARGYASSARSGMEYRGTYRGR
ncbi:MAG TPA: hypothetical protein VG225_07535 [Terracidiphilus sp.]|jgi:hypothetical protein|nr:hypothetical protein [Terracidiphilus sp.]